MNATAGALPQTDLDSLRQALMQMISAGRAAEAVEMVLDLLRRTSLRLAALELKNVGTAHRSESVTSAQLELFLKLLEEMSAASPSTTDEPSPAGAVDKGKEKPRTARPHGRGKFPASLPRKVEVIPVPAEECQCQHCNREKPVIGHEKTESLEMEPARLFVVLHRKEVRACRHCRADAVTAPAPERVLERAIPGPVLLTDVIVNKTDLALPRERQSRHYGQLGYRIPPSTLSDWYGAGTAMVEPLVKRFFEHILKAGVMQADGTGLKVLDRNHADGVRVGAIWVYVAMELPLCAFRFINDKDTDGPVITLKEREGYVVVDADQKLNPLFAAEGTKAIESGCNMHGRRYVHKALESGDPRAAVGIDLYNKVYRVEHDARVQGLDAAGIKALRQERSLPLMTRLGEWARTGALAEDPKSPLGRAFGYLTRQFKPLTRFLEDGRLPADNGASERAIRNIAVGRRMWLFAGSDAAAERAAFAFSLTGSCRLSHLNPRPYWQDALQKLSSGWPHAKIDELLPHNWAKTHPEHVTPPPPDGS